MSGGQRLRGKLHILAGRGQVAAKRDNAELWVLEELAGAPGEEQRWEAPSESDDASDHDRELHSSAPLLSPLCCSFSRPLGLFSGCSFSCWCLSTER